MAAPAQNYVTGPPQVLYPGNEGIVTNVENSGDNQAALANRGFAPNGWRPPFNFGTAPTPLWGSGQLIGLMPVKSTFTDEKEWYKAMVNYYCIKSQTIGRDRLLQNTFAYNAYSKVSETEKVPFYQQTGTGLETVDYFNPSTRYIEILTGEISSKDIDIEIETINPEAKSRKAEFHSALLMDLMIKNIEPELQKIAGQNLPDAKAILDKYKGSLNQYMDKEYKDIMAVQMKQLWEAWSEKNNFKEFMIESYKAFLMTDCAYSAPYIEPRNFEVVCDPIRLVQAISDVDCEDSFHKKEKYFISIEYVGFTELVSRYPDVDVEAIRKFNNVATQLWGLPVFLKLGGRDQYMIVHCTFIYPEQQEHEIESIKGFYEKEMEMDGNIFKVHEPTIEKEKIYHTSEQLYTSDLLAGRYYLSGGVVSNQIRSVSTPGKAKIPGSRLIYDYNISTTTPNNMVRIAQYVHAMNIAMNKIIMLTGQIKGSILVINRSKLAKFSDAKNDFERLEKTIDLINNNRLLFQEEGDDLISTGHVGRDKPVETISLDTNAQEINELINIVNFYDKKIADMLNISPSRTGNIQPYVTTTNGNTNLSQSDLGTKGRLVAFQQWLVNTVNDVINLLKISHYLKKQQIIQRLNVSPNAEEEFDAMSQIYGDEVMDFDDNMIYQDFGCYAKLRPNSDEYLAGVNEALKMAVQQKELSTLDYLKMLKYDNPEDKAAYLEKALEKQKAEALAQQKEQQEQAAQQQMQQQQMQQQGQQQIQQQASDNQLRNQALLQAQGAQHDQQGQQIQGSQQQAQQQALFTQQQALANQQQG